MKSYREYINDLEDIMCPCCGNEAACADDFGYIYSQDTLDCGCDGELYINRKDGPVVVVAADCPCDPFGLEE